MLSINTNLQSLIVQNNLTKSSNTLNQAIERMTTGFKLNHASDNAANYSISSLMSSKMSSYKIAEENAMIGLDMVQTASSTLDAVQNLTMRLRTLAEQAQNGTYGAQSIEAINNEAESIAQEIKRIVLNAEYNGLQVIKQGIEVPTAVSDNNMLKSGESGFIGYIMQDDGSDAVSLKEAVTNGTFNGRNGDVYSISSAEELCMLSDTINSGIRYASEGHYILTSDIDMTGADFTTIGSFIGILDGNGYTISNLELRSDERYGGGLINSIESNGTVKNLGLKNISVEYRTLSGGLALENHGTIDNCFIENSNIQSNNESGGLVFFNGGVIANSYAKNITVCGPEYDRFSDLLMHADGQVINSYTTSDLNNYQQNPNSTRFDIKNFNGDIKSIAADMLTVSAALSSGTTFVNGYWGISSVEDLQMLSELGRNDRIGENAKFFLTNDIDLSSYDNWTPIGDIVNTSLDGLGHNITGLTNNSLFSLIYNSNISNINIVDFDITKGAGKAGFVQTAVNSSFTNCSVSGSILGHYRSTIAGAGSTDASMFAHSLVNCDITSCIVSGNITGGEVGGFAYSASNCNFTNSSTDLNINLVEYRNYGSPPTIHAGRGGAFLYSWDESNITNCLYNSASGLNGIYEPDEEDLQRVLEITGKTIDLKGIDLSPTMLQVGINGDASSQISFNSLISLKSLDGIISAGMQSSSALDNIDALLKSINACQVGLGAVENRLTSVIESIGVSYENLVSSNSTIRDADIAKESSQYIKAQILQQASATLLATANQTPSLTLQLLNGLR